MLELDGCSSEQKQFQLTGFGGQTDMNGDSQQISNQLWLLLAQIGIRKSEEEDLHHQSFAGAETETSKAKNGAYDFASSNCVFMPFITIY